VWAILLNQINLIQISAHPLGNSSKLLSLPAQAKTFTLTTPKMKNIAIISLKLILIVLVSNIGVELISEGNLDKFPNHPLRYAVFVVLFSVVGALIINWYNKKNGKSSML
jgi:uncharacterized membrane protein YbjE (DUF340 family)